MGNDQCPPPPPDFEGATVGFTDGQGKQYCFLSPDAQADCPTGQVVDWIYVDYAKFSVCGVENPNYGKSKYASTPAFRSSTTSTSVAPASSVGGSTTAESTVGGSSTTPSTTESAVGGSTTTSA